MQPAAFGIVDAARYVGVSRSTIIVEIGSGRLPSAKVGRRRLLRVVDLDAWLADRVAAAE